MKNRVLSARYTMLADFYRQETIRSNSGQIVRRWNKEDPYIIQNRTDGIIVRGFTSVASTEKWSKDYEPVEYAKMYVSTISIDDDEKGPVTINRTFRVSNIRDRVSGEILWLNETRDPIEFHVLGVTPIQDPFGRNVEYEILLKGVVDG
jgi:hypothetical protein